MGQITVTQNVGGISGLSVIVPTVHLDARGYFTETYNARELAEYGITTPFVQDNESMSTRGVLRGMHFQKAHPQAKLVRVLSGEVFDVAVDLRAGSPTFGKWHGELLSDANKKQFYVPEGCAHGFLVLSKTARFAYKVTEFWHPGDEVAVRWDDPDIGIVWPLGAIDGEPLLSEKDAHNPTLAEYLASL